jgi:hypothetical protein
VVSTVAVAFGICDAHVHRTVALPSAIGWIGHRAIERLPTW